MRYQPRHFRVWRWLCLSACALFAITLLFHFVGRPSIAQAPDAAQEKPPAATAPEEAAQPKTPAAETTTLPKADEAKPAEKAPAEKPEPAKAEEKVPTETTAPAKPAEAEPKPAEAKTEEKAAETPAKADEKTPAVKPEPAKAEEAKPEAVKEPAEEKTAEESEEKDSEEAEESEEEEELTNESCIDCHNPDILEMSKEELAENVEVGEKPEPAKAKPLYVFGELNLAIVEDKYAKGVHVDTTCVECHQGIESLPHKQRLQSVDCSECHDDAVESIAASAHGKNLGKKAPPCIGCHDVHYGQGADAYVEQWKRKVCIDCHKAYGQDTLAVHKNHYEPKLHIDALSCLICHQGEEPGVHNMPAVKHAGVSCESCHSKKTILSETKPEPMPFMAYMTLTEFINKDALKKYGYVLGAHRIPALDLILILVVLGTFALPIFHGGLRILTRRKGPIEPAEEKILLHPLIERLWHWFQALCIVMLVITGVMLHWAEKFPGWFDWSVTVHNWFGIGAVVAFLVWLSYNLVTGRITHYFPNKGEIPGGMITQAKFYGKGIFKHEPHPYAPSEDNKFNPLQKIAYLQFQLLLFPILLISGILYMYPVYFSGVIDAIGGMTVLALFHYILGALFAAFLVAHLYLATTGETVGENFKAIITGYGIKEDHDTHV